MALKSSITVRKAKDKKLPLYKKEVIDLVNLHGNIAQLYLSKYLTELEKNRATKYGHV